MCIFRDAYKLASSKIGAASPDTDPVPPAGTVDYKAVPGKQVEPTQSVWGPIPMNRRADT